MTVKAVIFDLDGTLASFNIDSKAVRSDVRTLLAKTGLPASILSLNESIFEMLKKAEVFLKNNGKSEKAIADTREKALEIAEKYELEAAKNTSLLPNVSEALKTLKEMKVKIGLCTINSEKSANYILSRFKIATFFDAIVTRNKVKCVKPNVEHLEAALKALQACPDEAIVVGDSSIDMKCARELMATAVGLTTGLSTPKELMNSGANYIIASVADLPPLIQYLGKSSQT